MALVTTIYGDMDEGLLVKKEGVFENEVEKTSWIEYYLQEELVHRSASVFLKQGFVFPAYEGDINNG